MLKCIQNHSAPVKSASHIYIYIIYRQYTEEYATCNIHYKKNILTNIYLNCVNGYNYRPQKIRTISNMVLWSYVLSLSLVLLNIKGKGYSWIALVLHILCAVFNRQTDPQSEWFSYIIMYQNYVNAMWGIILHYYTIMAVFGVNKIICNPRNSILSKVTRHITMYMYNYMYI